MYAFNGFTEKANKVLNDAMQIASELGHTYIGSEHILCALCGEETGVAGTLLNKHNITKQDVYHKLETVIGKGIPTRMSPADFTPRSKRILEMSIYEARNLKHTYVGTEHLLMAILRESDSYAVAFLQEFGVNIRDLYSECINEVGEAGVSGSQENSYGS